MRVYRLPGSGWLFVAHAPALAVLVASRCSAGPVVLRCLILYIRRRVEKLVVFQG